VRDLGKLKGDRVDFSLFEFLYFCLIFVFVIEFKYFVKPPCPPLLVLILIENLSGPWKE